MKIRMQCLLTVLEGPPRHVVPLLKVFLARGEECCTLLVDPQHASLFAPPASYDVTIAPVEEA